MVNKKKKEEGIREFFKKNAELFYIVGIFLIFLTDRLKLHTNITSLIWLSSIILVLVIFLLLYWEIFLTYKFKLQVVLIVGIPILMLLFAFMFLFALDLYSESNKFALTILKAFWPLAIILMVIFVFRIILSSKRVKTYLKKLISKLGIK